MFHQGGLSNNAPSSSFNRNPLTLAAPPHSAIELRMRHSLQCISLKWTREEQHVLEVLLHRHAKEPVLRRYAVIAMQLENKSIRDVALRVRWMSKKENGNFGKGRKDGVKLAQGSKDKKGSNFISICCSAPCSKAISLCCSTPCSRVISHCCSTPCSSVISRWCSTPYNNAIPLCYSASASPLVPGAAMMNIDGGISYDATEGVIREQLEQNTQALSQISRNLASGQVQGSIKLFCQMRQNFLNIMNELSGIDLMRQMPPLPVKLDEIPILPEIDSAPAGCGA